MYIHNPTTFFLTKLGELKVDDKGPKARLNESEQAAGYLLTPTFSLLVRHLQHTSTAGTVQLKHGLYPWAMAPGPFGRIGRGARFRGSASVAKLALLTADFSPIMPRASSVETPAPCNCPGQAACSLESLPSCCKSHCCSNNWARGTDIF
jgi:hypothetical protein